ncbi:PREDICTED: 14 kDa phosphohistidine phosphatase-like [Gavialis gangeticus]|uniref:14 kDa phosphohistidine phosphatase-like n=1 Tax=Gavialis gangeticus TaxID=94835 RepID=UPI00092EFE1F|nr:PREDICTED: 14 kDa phosphohistidine phosphatase-like [Gavialis gangeticus]
MAELSAVPDVEIDADGVFKYVLLRVRPPSGAAKDVVRGYGWAEYHADIYEKAAAELEPRGFKCECLGGGRIAHHSAERRIHVYGYSVKQALMKPSQSCACAVFTAASPVEAATRGPSHTGPSEAQARARLEGFAPLATHKGSPDAF